MADAVKMVVVNGVRYRSEDAPKGATEEKAAPTPKNKARKPTNKSATAPDDEKEA